GGNGARGARAPRRVPAAPRSPPRRATCRGGTRGTTRCPRARAPWPRRMRESGAAGSGSGSRRRPRRLAAKPVADSAHGLDRVTTERPIDLLAQIADVDVDDVRVALVRVVPRVLEELDARKHVAGPAHERLEKSELLGGQLDLGVGPPDLARRRVEPKVADLELDRSLGGAATRERPQPREQLREGERLRQIVVGASIEPCDAVLDRISRREHEHGRPHTVLAPATADADPV